jgi:septum site-determining protein MinC
VTGSQFKSNLSPAGLRSIMEQHARYPLIEHFINAQLVDEHSIPDENPPKSDSEADNVEAANSVAADSEADNGEADNGEADNGEADNGEADNGEAADSGPSSAEVLAHDGSTAVCADVVSGDAERDLGVEVSSVEDVLPEDMDTISAAALKELPEGVSGSGVAASAAPAVLPASLHVTQEAGRAWVHIPSDASLASVRVALPELTLPGGVLWLSLGARPTTADEVEQLCVAANALLGRPVAGVKLYRSSLVDGLRKAADVVVEFDGEAPSLSSTTDSRGRQVLVIERTLRSGTSTRFRGDVLVYGDVNSGAEIEAAGNIVVLGTLRGLAWAGSGGDDAAMIVSFDLRPAQLRIGRRIAFLPERPRGRGPRLPEAAVVQDGEIVLRDYRGRMG